MPLHFSGPKEKVMLLFVIFYAFQSLPLVYTYTSLSTCCSSSLKVTQQRELKKTKDYSKNNLAGRPDQVIEKLRQNISLQKSQTCTQLMQGHTSMYIRMLQGENKIQIPSWPDHQHTFPFSSHTFPIHTFPIHFSHIPTPRNSVAKSTRHLFISSKRVSPDPRPAKCFYIQEIVTPEQIHVTQTKPGGIVRRTAASAPSTGHFPHQVTSARRCPEGTAWLQHRTRDSHSTANLKARRKYPRILFSRSHYQKASYIWASEESTTLPSKNVPYLKVLHCC